MTKIGAHIMADDIRYLNLARVLAIANWTGQDPAIVLLHFVESGWEAWLETVSPGARGLLQAKVLSRLALIEELVKQGETYQKIVEELT